MLPPISGDMPRPAYQHLQTAQSWEPGVAGAGSTEFRGPRVRPTLGSSQSQAVEVMMAAAVERGGVRAAFLNPNSGAGGGLVPTTLPTGALANTVVLGSGNMPVPMNLFATWEIDRSSPSCVPR